MPKSYQAWRIAIERFLTGIGLGMRDKLIILFVIIKVVPLILLALVAWRQAWLLGHELSDRTVELARIANEALSTTGDIAVSDAVKALDDRATEDLERMSTDAAGRVAAFLYARDADILFASSLSPDQAVYRRFVDIHRGRLIKQGQWELSPDGKSWRPVQESAEAAEVSSSIEENNHSFNYRPPESFQYENRPLYLEMSFIDLNGREKIKVTSAPYMDSSLKDISRRENTFIKAETYFNELKQLKPGEVYVSEVIGAYVPSRVIGMYTPENAVKAGEEFAPEKSAYAGRENPLGRRFKGLVRWGAPVLRGGQIIGYVTLALDHDHIMEFTSHQMPSVRRYTEIPDASEGNYAFI